jgi:periplasmic protein TonB
VASPASTASQNLDSTGNEPSQGPSRPAAKAAGEVIAITVRDDFLLELSESLSGQASVRPVDSMPAALSHLAGSRLAHVLVIDTRDLPDVRGDVERAMAQAPNATILVFAPAEAEKVVAGSLKGSNIFAVLPIPIDRRKTAAIFEGAIADATARRAAHPGRGEMRVEARPEMSYEAEAPSLAGPDEPPTPQISKSIWIGIAIAVVVVAAGGYWMMTKDEGPAPSVAGPTAPAAKAPSASTAPVEQAAPQKSVIDVPLVKGRTDELLEKARLAMRERRYTEPASDSAMLYYRSALAADPGNGEASDGMTRIANLLITRFEESMDASKYDDAADALLSLKAAAPADTRLSGLETRLTQSQVTKAIAEGNIERAALLVRNAQQSNSVAPDLLAKWTKDIKARQDEAKVKRLVDLANGAIKDGRLVDPADDSAKAYLAQLREVPGTNASVQRIQRDLNGALLRKAREAQLANKQADADKWLAEARAAGASAADITAFQREVVAAKAKAASAEAERYAQLVRDRIRDGRLTEPSNDSAMYYLSQANSADANGTIAAAVGRELSTKLIERAGSAARDGRTAQVDADLAAARRLGADPSDIAAVQQIVASGRNKTATIAPRPQPQVNKLKRVRYAPPEYPQKAFQQKLTGSVTVEFVVDVNGEPRDARVVDSDPPEVFDKAALSAVKRWRYEPVVVNNVPTEVPTRMVIRFELPK